MNKDIIGQPLEVGDIVAFTHARTTQLHLAKIVKFSGSWVTIARPDGGYEQRKSQDRVLKITGQYQSFEEELPELFI